MAQQALNTKGNMHGLVNGGTGLCSPDKQPSVAVKKTALRDLQNNQGMLTPKTLARTGPISDAIKLSGTKRTTPEFPLNPPSHQSPSNNTGIRGNCVYMRRKFEQEPGKSNTCVNMNNDSISQTRQLSHGKQELPHQQTQMQPPKVPSYSTFPAMSTNTSYGGPSVALSLGKPGNTMSYTDLNHPPASPGILSVNAQKTSNQHSKERFFKLQMFLKDYDNSSYEDYNKMLRSLSSHDRSKHAVELEKRAIHLMLDESKELQRMKALNILTKSSSKNNVSPSATPQEMRWVP